MQTNQNFQFKQTFQKGFMILVSRCPADYPKVAELEHYISLTSLNEDQVKSFSYYTKKYLMKLLKDLRSGNETDIEKAKTEIEGNGNDKALTAIECKGVEKLFTDTKSKELGKAKTVKIQSKIESEVKTEKVWDSVTNLMTKNERDLAFILLFSSFKLNITNPESQVESLDLMRIAFRQIIDADKPKNALKEVLAKFKFYPVTTRLADLLLDVAELDESLNDKLGIESELNEQEIAYIELIL
jgi:hypothetical protein